MREQLIQPVSQYFGEKNDFQCVHGVPFDSECGECIEDKKIVDDSVIQKSFFGDSIEKEMETMKEANKGMIDFRVLHSSLNNGGKTDYYQLGSAPFQIKDFDDFAEWRNMNGNQFNMGKVMWTFNVGRHNGTDYERDLNKIIHYAQRELLRIKR